MSKKSYLKEAEQNIVNQAKAWTDMLEIMDALANFGNRACKEHVGRSQFFEGLTLMRQAIFREQSEAFRQCFYFIGVGGKEAEEYSQKMFKYVFGGQYAIMHFLDKWGNCPSSWISEDEKKFRQECQEAIAEMEAE